MTSSSQDIPEAIRSFSGCSGGGVNGLRPIHLISNQTAEAENRLILSLTSLVNTFLNGPLSRGKCLIWDSNCVDSFSASALALTATEPGSASRSAEVRKNLKYEGLCDRYIFQAIAIESSGVFGRDTNIFISRLGHLITLISGERREADFQRQRLSLATVRGNAQSATQAGRPSS